MYDEPLRAPEMAIADLDFRMNEGCRISKAELANFKTLADALAGIIETYEMPIFKLVKD